MSKVVTLYEVNFELLSKHVPGLIAGHAEFNAFVQALATAPETIAAKDYAKLMKFLSAHLLSENDFSKELAELGIMEIETFHPTYRAVVFMELLWDIMPEVMTSSEYNLYKLTMDELLVFANFLLLLKELFLQHEAENGTASPRYEINVSIREKFTPFAEEIVKRESERRNELGEDYSGKWFAQYFHFFETADPESLRRSVWKGLGNTYLIDDSY